MDATLADVQRGVRIVATATAHGDTGTGRLGARDPGGAFLPNDVGLPALTVSFEAAFRLPLLPSGAADSDCAVALGRCVILVIFGSVPIGMAGFSTARWRRMLPLLGMPSSPLVLRVDLKTPRSYSFPSAPTVLRSGESGDSEGVIRFLRSHARRRRQVKLLFSTTAMLDVLAALLLPPPHLAQGGSAE